MCVCGEAAASLSAAAGRKCRFLVDCRGCWLPMHNKAVPVRSIWKRGMCICSECTAVKEQQSEDSNCVRAQQRVQSSERTAASAQQNRAQQSSSALQRECTAASSQLRGPSCKGTAVTSQQRECTACTAGLAVRAWVRDFAHGVCTWC